MDKRIKPLLRSLEAQGWRVESKTNGWMCWPPDTKKPGVMLHRTPSDGNWLKQAMRLLKASGFKSE